MKAKVSPSWRITPEEDELRLHAGADLTLLVARTNAEQSRFCQQDVFERESLAAPDATIFDELFTAGVIVPCDYIPKEPHVQHVHEGDVIDKKTELIVYYRETMDYQEGFRRVKELKTIPYLFVDVAYHHTISIGPFVIPGETACGSCYMHRIVNRWGDETPPQNPAIQHSQKLIDVLVNAELQRIVQGDTSLIGYSSTWNIQARDVQMHQVLKVDSCPLCNGTNNNGKIELPWLVNP